MVAAATARWGPDAVAVAALSGSAALAIGGQTLHALFGMDTRPLSRESWMRNILERPGVSKLLTALRVLFVDDVCTLPSSRFGRLGYVMRRVAPPRMEHIPFGVCQSAGMLRTLAVCYDLRLVESGG